MPTETLQIPAGEFRWEVCIQAPNPAKRDDFGEPISNDWTTVRLCRAQIKSQQTATYRATTQDDTIVSQALYIFTVRWTPTPITPDMRISFRGELYQINTINNVLQRNRFIQLYVMRIDD